MSSPHILPTLQTTNYCIYKGVFSIKYDYAEPFLLHLEVITSLLAVI